MATQAQEDVIHRLSKNSAADILGTKGYALLTGASTAALGLDPQALGLREHLEMYEDVGEVPCFLDDLGERWRLKTERRRIFVSAEEARRRASSGRSPSLSTCS